MSGLVDIHTHLLPGIDDGPETLDESIEMARAAVAAGITTIAATPHLRSDFPGVRVAEIADRCESLQQVFDEQRIPLRIVSGAEVSLVWALEATDEELRLASYGQRGTDLLIETPDDVSMIERLLYPVRGKGYRITLAHPERNPRYYRDRTGLERLTEQGVLLQINAAALVAARRSPPGRLAASLCRDGLAHALGSDGHRGTVWRPVTMLADAFAALSELVGSERARWMGVDAPAAIVDGGTLPEQPPVRVEPGRGGWFRRR